MDKFLQLLERSGVLNCIVDESVNNGRPSFNKYDMLATILYCFAFSSGTLRDIKLLCKYDLEGFIFYLVI